MTAFLNVNTFYFFVLILTTQPMQFQTWKKFVGLQNLIGIFKKVNLKLRKKKNQSFKNTT